MKNLDQKMASKPATIFDHLANITWKKTNWNKLDEASQKSFSPYLINRWLSMNPNYIEIVDMFQQYTIGPLSKKHVYQLYLDFLPKQKSIICFLILTRFSAFPLFFFFANSTDIIFLSKFVTVIQPNVVLNDNEFIIIIEIKNIV